MVKLNDPLMAKKYGHRDPPGLGFFRKGNYVKYDGKMNVKLPHPVYIRVYRIPVNLGRAYLAY